MQTENITAIELFNLITGPAQIPTNNLPTVTLVETNVGSVKALGPNLYNLTQIECSEIAEPFQQHSRSTRSIRFMNAELFQAHLNIVSMCDVNQRVVTGSFSRDGKYNMITGQARRDNIPLQLLSDSIEIVESLKKSMIGHKISSKTVLVDSGKIHCLIGLDGKLDGMKVTRSLSKVLAFFPASFVIVEHTIFSFNPEYVKYGNFGRYIECAVSVTFDAAPENVSLVLEWCKSTEQTRVGFEFGTNFTNVEF
jgi:hypothetical protein